MKEYADRNDITKDILLYYLRELKCTSCQNLKKGDLFAEEEIDFETIDNLVDKIFEELELQEHIARSALQLFPQGNARGIQSYSWEMGIESDGTLRKRIYLIISLVLVTTDPGRGRILFPLLIVKCKPNQFKYWEVINKDDALIAVRSLLQDS